MNGTDSAVMLKYALNGTCLAYFIKCLMWSAGLLMMNLGIIAFSVPSACLQHVL